MQRVRLYDSRNQIGRLISWGGEGRVKEKERDRDKDSDGEIEIESESEREKEKEREIKTESAYFKSSFMGHVSLGSPLILCFYGMYMHKSLKKLP